MDTTWLDIAERISRVGSVAAIPVVLAVGGWVIQRQLQNRTVSRDYVQLALVILQNPDRSQVPPELREWAVDLLNENSPTKLNMKALESLKSGAVTLPLFNFVPTSSLTPELRNSLEASLRAFQSYLENLGFQKLSRSVSVQILDDSRAEEGVALWDPLSSSILVTKAFAGDKASVLRQLAHQYLAPSASTSHEYSAIESGLATYFACSYLDHPMLGDQATAEGKALLPPQDLRNDRRISEIDLNDWGSVQNDGSEIWGAVLWQVRMVLGKQKADPLLAEAWRSLDPKETGRGSSSTVFARDVIRRMKLEGASDQQTTAAASSFKRRGLLVADHS